MSNANAYGKMQTITSRSNAAVKHVKKLGNEREYRTAVGEFVCDGLRCLREAVTCESTITAVFATSDKLADEFPNLPITLVSQELLEYLSPLKSAQDVVFTCKLKQTHAVSPAARNVVLDGIQDPGNVGTIIRSASAFGVDSVILVNACADLYNPKTVRATMGAIFRQNVVAVTLKELQSLTESGMVLFGAALDDEAPRLDRADLSGASIAIGSEGAGLSREVLDLCKTKVFIPMETGTESLNAAIAASIIMWEAYRD